MTSLFFIILSFLQGNFHTQYIFNQNIHRTKSFTILEIQFIGKLKVCGLKYFLVSTLNTMGGILYGDIGCERSTI